GRLIASCAISLSVSGTACQAPFYGRECPPAFVQHLCQQWAGSCRRHAGCVRRRLDALDRASCNSARAWAGLPGPTQHTRGTWAGPPMQILEAGEEVIQLHFFPDGRRLLAAVESPDEVVNFDVWTLPNGGRLRLKLPKLRNDWWTSGDGHSAAIHPTGE